MSGLHTNCRAVLRSLVRGEGGEAGEDRPAGGEEVKAILIQWWRRSASSGRMSWMRRPSTNYFEEGTG